MLTIVASTKAMNTPSEETARTVVGAGARRRRQPLALGVRHGAHPGTSVAPASPAGALLGRAPAVAGARSREPRRGILEHAPARPGRPPSPIELPPVEHPHPRPPAGSRGRRDAGRLAVSVLPTVTVLTTVSPKRGTSASLPVRYRRIGLPSRAMPGPHRLPELAHPPVTSTAITGPSPGRAMVPTGRLSSTPPSTSSRPSGVEIGGKTPGIERLARTASRSGPVLWTTGSRLIRSQLTQK